MQSGVGCALPPAIALIQRKSWSDGVRALIAFAVGILASLGICHFNGLLDGRSLVSAMLTVLVTAIATGVQVLLLACDAVRPCPCLRQD